ncbi:MAG: hypothetical protein ACRD0J_04515 [Acidimicrobiales bacterium]
MTDESIQALEERSAAFRAAHGEGVFSASRTINPLLEVWELANAVDHSVAEPIEGLLTAMVGRELTTAKELLAAMDELDTKVSALSEPAGV